VPGPVSMEDWVDCIEEAELPLFRQCVVRGEWDRLRDHATRAVRACRPTGTSARPESLNACDKTAACQRERL
jgi:hypothetical protein